MTLPRIASDRFRPERGLRICVQMPPSRVAAVLEAVQAEDAMAWGDYDRVSFETRPGIQSFRSLGTGRNAATGDTVAVDCAELSFFVTEDRAAPILRAIYRVHPYEEPVIFVTECLRTLHIRGLDEDNPNRFWNRPAEDWVPDAHRPSG